MSSPSIVKKAKAGLLALNARSLVTYCLQAASVLILSRLLSPDDYGTFGIINGWVGISVFFTDIGISGALVQQKALPTGNQLLACTLLQLALSTLLAALFWFVAPAIVAHYSLPADDGWMMRILALSLPIYSGRSAARVVLERALRFGTIAKIDIAETAAGYLVQIAFAIWRASPWCFVAALVARSLLGTLVTNAVVLAGGWKWRGERFSFVALFREVRPLFRYGAAFQANAILPALRGLMVPIVLASLLSVGDVGLITWTTSMAAIPLVLAYNYNQVLFPSIARMQSNPDELRRVVNRSLQLAFLGFALMYGLGAAASSGIIGLLFSKKWLLAKPLVPAACLATGLSTARFLCASVLNATGRPATRLWIEAVTIVLEFGVVAMLVHSTGAAGYFPALALVGLLGLGLTVHALRKELDAGTFWRATLALGATLIPYAVLRLSGMQDRLLIAAPAYLLGFVAITLLFIPNIRSELS